MSCCKFKFRKRHEDLIENMNMMKTKRFNIAKLARSQPSELRSTNSTEQIQIKEASGKIMKILKKSINIILWSIRKHHENLKEIDKYHIMMRYEEKNRFKGRLTRLKRLADRRSHWMPLVVNRVRGGVTRSLVQSSFKSDCVSVTQHVLWHFSWKHMRWTVINVF